MKKLSREFKIGSFVLAVLVISFFIINFLRGKDIFNREMSVISSYDDIEGLVQSDPVYIKGYKAGTVRQNQAGLPASPPVSAVPAAQGGETGKQQNRKECRISRRQNIKRWLKYRQRYTKKTQCWWASSPHSRVRPRHANI